MLEGLSSSQSLGRAGLGGGDATPILWGWGKGAASSWLGQGPAGLLRRPHRQYSRSMLAISSSSE